VEKKKGNSSFAILKEKGRSRYTSIFHGIREAEGKKKKKKKRGSFPSAHEFGEREAEAEGKGRKKRRERRKSIITFGRPQGEAEGQYARPATKEKKKSASSSVTGRYVSAPC